jgi:Ctr copper transporter family
MDQHHMEGHMMEGHITAHGGGELPSDNASTFCHGNGMIMYMDGMVLYIIWRNKIFERPSRARSFSFSFEFDFLGWLVLVFLVHYLLALIQLTSPTNQSSPGFHLSMRGGHRCLSLLLPSWTLDSRGKFLCACGGVVAFAVAVEGLTKLRYYQQQQQQLQQQRRSSSSLLVMLVPLLHGLQALAGYLLMLIAMTYSVELLLSVMIGLALGYQFFFYRSPAAHRGISANPCCDFLLLLSKDNNIGVVPDNNNSNNSSNHNNGDNSVAAATTTTGGCCDPLLPHTAAAGT